MKILCIFVNLMIFSILFLCSCTTNTKNETSRESSGNLYWATEDGVFYTKDIERAQKEIPYEIILPNYLPGVNIVTLFPNIKGPLRGYSIHGGEEIEIYYILEPGSNNSSLVRIFETDQDFSLGNPELDRSLEKLTIDNRQVIKSYSEVLGTGIGSGKSINFSFNANGVYFVVEIYKIQEDEAIKIIESMIKQIE